MMSKKSRLYGGWGCLGCCFGWCPKQAVGLWASIYKSWHAPLAPFHQILLLFLDECFDSKTPSKEELAKLLHPTHNRNKIVKYQMLGNGQEVEFSDSVKYEVSSSQGSLTRRHCHFVKSLLSDESCGPHGCMRGWRHRLLNLFLFLIWESQCFFRSTTEFSKTSS